MSDGVLDATAAIVRQIADMVKRDLYGGEENFKEVWESHDAEDVEDALHEVLALLKVKARP